MKVTPSERAPTNSSAVSSIRNSPPADTRALVFFGSVETHVRMLQREYVFLVSPPDGSLFESGQAGRLSGTIGIPGAVKKNRRVCRAVTVALLDG